MKAALCKSLDGPAGLVVEDIAVPQPGPGEALIAVKAAALNFFDTLITRGKYQAKPELPFSPAGEVAGVVEALGPGVGGVKIGDRVMVNLGWGGAREKVIAEAAALVAIPDGVSDAIAAGVSVTYGTAIHGLKDRGRLKAGETVAVLGAAGGAGLAAVEIAKLMGARVIAVASSPEKLAVCLEHGADEAVNYASADLKEGLRALTGGNGVDVVYDCVGGEFFGGGAARDGVEWALSRRRICLGRHPENSTEPAAAEGLRRHRRVLGRSGEARPGRASRQHAPGAGMGGAGAAASAHPRHLSAGRDPRSALRDRAARSRRQGRADAVIRKNRHWR